MEAHAPQLVFTRHQYRYKTDGDYPETWIDIPNSGQNASGEGDGSNLTGYTVTGLVGGQLHTFQVRTSFSTYTSDPSDEAMATTRSAVVSFGAGSYSVDEGGTVEVTVQLDTAPGREVVVPVSAAATADVTATWTASTIESDEKKAAADLESTTGPVTVTKSQTTATFTVATAGDTLDEYDETFTVTLSSPSNAPPATSSRAARSPAARMWGSS